MSTFRVDLSQTGSAMGALDVDPTTGLPATQSVQRTIMVTGPNRIQRQLKDGDTFTDNNYWKQFAYPQCSLDQAFIVVTSDDGSVYSTVPSENTVVATWLPGTAGVLVATKTYTDTDYSLDLSSTPAKFVQIQNTDGSHPCKVKINGTAIFTLEANSSQIFNPGDLVVTSIAFDNSVSGASNVNFVQVIYSYQSVATS